MSHTQLVSFCNGVSPEHASVPSKLRKAASNRLSPNSDLPCGMPPTELSQARGHLACLTASTPDGSDRSLQRIYPDPTGSSTPCRETVPNRTWNSLRSGDPAVVGLLRTIPPETLDFHPSSLPGPPFTPSRERGNEQPHPRCLLPTRGFPMGSGIPSPPPKRLEPSVQRLFDLRSCRI